MLHAICRAFNKNVECGFQHYVECCRNKQHRCCLLHAAYDVDCWMQQDQFHWFNKSSVVNKMSQVTVTAAAYLVIRNARKTRKRKHRWWKKELFINNVTAHNDFLGKLLTNDQSLFTNFSRMSVDSWRTLILKHWNIYFHRAHKDELQYWKKVATYCCGPTISLRLLGHLKKH